MYSKHQFNIMNELFEEFLASILFYYFFPISFVLYLFIYLDTMYDLFVIQSFNLWFPYVCAFRKANDTCTVRFLAIKNIFGGKK